MTAKPKPQGYYTDKIFTPADMDMAIEKEREACALIVDKAYRNCKMIEETHYKYSPAPFNPAQFGLNMEIVSQSKYLSYAIRARGQA